MNTMSRWFQTKRLSFQPMGTNVLGKNYLLPRWMSWSRSVRFYGQRCTCVGKMTETMSLGKCIPLCFLTLLHVLYVSNNTLWHQYCKQGSVENTSTWPYVIYGQVRTRRTQATWTLNPKVKSVLETEMITTHPSQLFVFKCQHPSALCEELDFDHWARMGSGKISLGPPSAMKESRVSLKGNVNVLPGWCISYSSYSKQWRIVCCSAWIIIVFLFLTDGTVKKENKNEFYSLLWLFSSSKTSVS